MKIVSLNKNKLPAACLLLALIILVSCKKLVELPGNPPTLITRGQQFEDSASVLSALAGAYTYNQSKGFGYSDANFTIATGLSSDELSTNQSSTDKPQFYSYTLTSVNSGIIALWRYPFQGMYQVNDILEGISGNSKLSPAFVKQITGEMEVLRALYNFNMVNLFGGIPLVNSTDYTITSRLPRSSVEAVYDQILADLTDAVKNLPATYPSAGRLRPNLYTAKALLAKVYLYRGQWQAAYNEADDIIKSNVYSIADVPLSDVFTDGSKEAIWQIPVKNTYQQTAEAQNFVPSGATTPRYPVTPFLLEEFETGDQRAQNWIGAVVVNGKILNYPSKYKNRLASNVPLEDYMIFRLAEVVLIRAEAAARLNMPDQALADINIIRTRAGLPRSTANRTSTESVLNAVMHERQTELCFEWGNRWFDLKRNVTPATSASAVLSSEKNGYSAHAEFYPIPQAQMLLNDQLVQNPGYN